LYHASDLHIHGSRYRNGRVEDLLHQVPDSAHLVITGDVTDDGRPDQYAEAERLLAPFAGRLTLVPGNHDLGAWGVEYNPESWRNFIKLVEALGAVGLESKTVGNYLIIGLDSTLKTRSPFDLAQGRVGWWQRYRMRLWLNYARSRKLQSVVCLHHHFDGGWALKLQDADQFLRDTWGLADLVLFGHKHEEFTWTARAPIATVYHSAYDEVTDVTPPTR
jgi:3',5'-cyclic AMP phosphodiesterase CpdA